MIFDPPVKCPRCGENAIRVEGRPRKPDGVWCIFCNNEAQGRPRRTPSIFYLGTDPHPETAEPWAWRRRHQR